MHGRTMLILVFAASLSGCSEPSAPAPQRSSVPAKLGDAFDAAATGTIRGRVVWDGAVPAAEEMVVRTNAFNPYLYKNPARFQMPHVPKVHPQTHGVANAVVYLRSVELRRAKSWDHPKVRVEFHERRLLIEQGSQRTQVGFVRRGDAVEIVNRDAEYHNLHARGAAFFAQPLIEANQVRERTLTQAGVVDLSCAGGYYWLNAHLFVADHPYYTRTAADGSFVLDQVPAGNYEVMCWLPNWQVLRKEVDPETSIIARWAWADPKEKSQSVSVAPGQTSDAGYTWTAGDFK